MKKCAFVTPIYIKPDRLERFHFFKETIRSVFNQTCDDWLLVLIDDGSKNDELDEYINSLKICCDKKIFYKKNEVNLGAGISRNIGIELAEKAGADVIMFLDSDDIAHPRRVELTKEYFENKDIDVLYSYFIPIDEYGNEIVQDKLPANIKFILENDKNALYGEDVWKKLICRNVYINLTSSTSVRCDLARKVPFPPLRSSEDLYVWMMYSAVGGKYYYLNNIPSKYRIPQETPGKSLSTCFGKENANRDFSEAYIKAIEDCIEFALNRKAIIEDDIPEIKRKAYDNLLNELRIAGMDNLVNEYKLQFFG